MARATVHHVRPATYAHTNLDLHTRIVARVQHVAQRHCHLLSYLSHHRNQSPHPSSSPIIRNHRHPVPHRRFRRCTPRPALHTQRASNAHAQAAPLSASAAATAQRRTRSQSHDHHHVHVHVLYMYCRKYEPWCGYGERPTGLTVLSGRV